MVEQRNTGVFPNPRTYTKNISICNYIYTYKGKYYVLFNFPDAINTFKFSVQSASEENDVVLCLKHPMGPSTE